MIGLILFPAGMDNPMVLSFCNNDGNFDIGDCQLGWAFIVIIVGTVLAAVATPLSLSTLKWREKEREMQSFSV